MQARRWRPSRGDQAVLAACLVRLSRLVLCLSLLTLPALAIAEDGAMIQIRARTRLSLRELEHHGQRGRFSVSISAQLSDPASTAQPDESPGDSARSFDGMRLLLSLESDQGPLLRESVSTDRQGLASHTFGRLPAGVYRLRAQFAGDDLRDPVEATLDIPLDRRPSELGFSVGSTHQAGAPLSLSDVLVRSQGRPVAASVQLSVFASQNGKASGPKLAQQTVFLDGADQRQNQGPINLFLSPAAAPGHLLLVRADYAGDIDTAPAWVEREVLVVTQAHITLEASASEVPQGGVLRLSGTVFTTTEKGSAPLAQELVDFEASQAFEPIDSPRSPDPAASFAGATSSRPPLRRLLGTAVSDDQGRFVLHIPRLPLRAAATDLIAKVVPAHRYIRPGVSNEVHLSVLPPEPVSLLPFLLPLAMSAFLALLFHVQRILRPRLANWLKARRAHRRAERVLASPSGDERGAAEVREPRSMAGTAGVSLSARGSLSLRRTVDTTLDGTVFDAAFGSCVARAQVIVTTLTPDPATPQRTGESDDEGRFVLSQLRPGRCVVRISAPGYQPQEFSATVPHRGELRGITVRLQPLRIQLLADWQRVAQLLYGDAALVQTRTPQDLLRDARTAPGSPSAAHRPLQIAVSAEALSLLQELTALVEEGYYSGRICSESMLQESRRLAALIAPGGVPTPSGLGRTDAAPRPLH